MLEKLLYLNNKVSPKRGMVMSNIISMKDISWRRNGKNILQDINWSVTKRQHWAVLGLNGSGKSTMLKMLNGYIWPTTGTIRVLGQQFGRTDIRELRKSIGWVSSSLEMRIRSMQRTQDVIVSGKYASIGLYEEPHLEHYEKAYRLMENLGCAHLCERTYEACSQGEKQKVLIARALMASPKLLILDEPTNGLDFIAREDLLSTVEQLAVQVGGPTILFVTHHIEEVLPVFSHTLLLRQGTVYAQGERENVLNGARLTAFFKKKVQLSWYQDRAWMALQG